MQTVGVGGRVSPAFALGEHVAQSVTFRLLEIDAQDFFSRRFGAGDGVPADVFVERIGGGYEVAVDFLESGIVFSGRVRYAAFFGDVCVCVEVACVRAVVVDGVIDGDFFVYFNRERVEGVAEQHIPEGQTFVDAPGPVAAVDSGIIFFVLAIDSQIVDRRICDLVEEDRAGAVRSFDGQPVNFEVGAAVSSERTDLVGLLFAVDGDIADAHAFAVGSADGALHMPVVAVRHVIRAIGHDGQVADGSAVAFHTDTDVASRNRNDGLVRASALQGDVLGLVAEDGHAAAPRIILVVEVRNGIFAGSQVDGLAGHDIFHSGDQVARRIVFGPAAARGARSDIPRSSIYLGNIHGKVALRAVVAIPADVVGRACGGIQKIALVIAGIQRFHDRGQIVEGNGAGAGVDAQHTVKIVVGAGTDIVDPVEAAFARSELVPNGAIVRFVFAFLNGGVIVVALRASNRGDKSILQVVVARNNCSLKVRVEGSGVRDGVGADLRRRLEVIAVQHHQLIAVLGRGSQRDHIAAVIGFLLRRYR